jgi:hypothetical protein
VALAAAGGVCVSVSRVLHGWRTEQQAVAVANSVSVHF